MIERDESKARLADCAAITKAITETFALCDATVNEWNANSDASRLNEAPSAVPHVVSEPLWQVLNTSVDAHAATRGRFDPSVAPLSSAWRNALSRGEVLPRATLDGLLPLIGMEKLSFDGAARTVTKAHDGVCLDLGGVSKGWTVDELVRRLSDEFGFPDVLCEWGGDVKACGVHPERLSRWRLGLEKPPPLEVLFARFEATEADGKAEGNAVGGGAGASATDTDDAGGAGAGAGAAAAAEAEASPTPLTTVRLRSGRALAVSGDAAAARKFGYHHIVDTDSGALLKCGQSAPALVAVEADSCALADAIATALMAATSLDELQEMMSAAATDGSLPASVHRYWAYSRDGDGGVLVSGDPRVVASRERTAESLRSALRGVSSQVAVIASADEEEHAEVAITATSVVSCSMEPPMLTFNVKATSPAAAALTGRSGGGYGGGGYGGGGGGVASGAVGSETLPPSALTQLSICFAGVADETAARRYAEPRSLTAEERAVALSEWWARAEDGRHAWKSLRGAIASLRCETRAVVPTGGNVTVVAEVVGVHNRSPSAGSDAGAAALHYQAGRGYFAG